MATDFTYGGKQIVSSGPFKPNGKDMPSDARTRVDCYADIATIPNPYVGLKITVKVDETNNNKMTDYIVKSLKANSIGLANSLIDEVVRYVDYLGVSAGGGTSEGTGTGLTSEQVQQLQTAYQHSQSTHVNSNDIPTKISQLENDSEFVTQTQLDNVVTSAGGFTVKNLSTSEISEILSAISVVVPVESIVASTNYLSINVGETRQITYTIIPANATDKTVTYSSSDNSKVSVDQLGNIRALEEGDVLITITCSNGVSTDCQIVVSAVSEVVAVTGISLNKTSVSMHTGDTFTLKATITPTNATNKSVKWESSAPTVASIDNNGLVTALSDGSATITCTSLSNASISANCTIDITTIKTLTSVTNGLVHSYDLTALNGSSATVEDLIGDVVLTMDGFSDVASAKTADGIVTEANSILKQEAVSPTVTNEYSIVFTVKGARGPSQGLLKCNRNGNDKGFAISYTNNAAVTMTPLCMTHTGFLFNGLYSTRDAFNYETITVTADYNTKEIKLYSGSHLLGTASFDGFEWSNKAWFNDGYWGTKAGMCYRNILMYNRILSGEEVATIASEVCPSGANTANSPMVTANNRILTHISCNSTLTEGVLPNLVTEHYPLNSVASTTPEGFLVSAFGTTYIKQYFSQKVTYVVKLGTVPINSNAKRIINGLTDIEKGTFSMYSYIKDSKFAVRDNTRWLVAEQTVTINNINVIMVESDVTNNTVVVYFNNKQVGSSNNFFFVFSGLENTEIPIKDFIIYDGIFDEETRTAIYNELIGGDN